MMKFKQLQQEQAEWNQRNFGEQPAWIARDPIDIELPARTPEDRLDALADVVVFGAGLATALGVSYGEVVERVWSRVKTRDWRADPVHGVTGGEAEQTRG